MSNDNLLWRLAEQSMKDGIDECSKNYEDSPQHALDLIRESAETFKEVLPNKPAMLAQVLGQYLAIAALALRPDAVLLLKELGASMEYRNKDGMTPLQVAVTKDHCDMLRTLAGEGANLDALYAGQFHKGTALHLAVAQGKLYSLQILLEIGADVDAVDPETGDTALMRAASRKADSGTDTDREKAAKLHTELVASLMNMDANPRLRNQKGHLPLYMAIDAGNIPSTKQLLMYGDDYQPDELTNALVMAAARNQPEVIEALVKAGADILRPYQGYTVTDACRPHAKPETLTLLHSLITQAEVKKALPAEGATKTTKSAPKKTAAPL